MKKQTLGMMITTLRKEKQMTQLDLAEKMGVTDKAVSKWERDLSLPDINSIVKLAEIFGVSIDELIQAKTKNNISFNKVNEIVDTALKGVAIAMGIAVVVLSILGELETKTAFVMLGIGLVSISISLLKYKEIQK